MSLRVRIAIAASLAVIITFGVGSVVTYQVTKRSLYTEIDDSLRAAAVREARDAARSGTGGAGGANFGGQQSGRFGAPGIFAELISGAGR